jgi:ferredoxin
MSGSPPRLAPLPAHARREAEAQRLIDVEIEVDGRRCCSAGHCARLLPEVFEQDELDGTAVVTQPHPPSALASRAREVAAICPTNAITITVRG